MKFSYNNRDYDIVIEKKTTTRNTYIRVKKDLKVHVTTNIFTSMRSIRNLIEESFN